MWTVKLQLTQKVYAHPNEWPPPPPHQPLHQIIQVNDTLYNDTCHWSPQWNSTDEWQFLTLHAADLFQPKGTVKRPCLTPHMPDYQSNGTETQRCLTPYECTTDLHQTVLRHALAATRAPLTSWSERSRSSPPARRRAPPHGLLPSDRRRESGPPHPAWPGPPAHCSSKAVWLAVWLAVWIAWLSNRICLA